jgi:hypothetical protein
MNNIQQCVTLLISVVDPSNSLAMLPFSVLLFALSIDIHTTTMLLALVPGTDVFATVGPFKCPIALLHIVNVVSDIPPAIRPCEGPVALHLVVPPLTRENSAISPLVDSTTVNVVIIKVAGVCAIISPGELAIAVLLPLKVLSLV